MQRKELQRPGHGHSLKALDVCFLEGKRAVRLARGCTANSVAGYHVLHALPTRSLIPDLECGLQVAAQLHEHCWGKHHNGREASEASVAEV